MMQYAICCANTGAKSQIQRLHGFMASEAGFIRNSGGIGSRIRSAKERSAKTIVGVGSDEYYHKIEFLKLRDRKQSN